MSKTRLWRHSLSAVCTEEELRLNLETAGQVEWCTRVRLRGLLLLVDFAIRTHSPQGYSIPADLAHGYVSAIRRPKRSHTIREPLAVLVRVGILKRVRRATNGWHLKLPAAYALGEDYVKRRLKLDVGLPPYLSKKRLSALDRLEHRLNRRYPFRATLLNDLGKLCFSPDSRGLIADLLREKNLTPAVVRALQAVDGAVHWVRVSPRGQITTSVAGCPKMLKAQLLIDGEPAVSCDVSHAHHCFLPALIRDRIGYLRKHSPRAFLGHYEAELRRLVEYLSEGDYYRKWCVDPADDAEREEKKGLVNVLLNLPNAKCEANGLYRRMHAAFPLTFRVCEDIKRQDHRNISKSLQYYTGEAINGALVTAQAQGIAAIPDVDALICQVSHKEVVCALIGQHVYDISHGVCCKVGGIRYQPATGPQQQLFVRALSLTTICNRSERKLHGKGLESHEKRNRN